MAYSEHFSWEFWTVRLKKEKVIDVMYIVSILYHLASKQRNITFGVEYIGQVSKLNVEIRPLSK